MNTVLPVHLLIVDDDHALCSLLEDYLTQQGYRISIAHDGTDMWRVLRTDSISLVILDLMLPGEDGLSLLRQLRQQDTLAVLMLSARGEELDRIIGLEVGADDYLAKPFNPRELLARIRALLRRSQWQAGILPDLHTYRFGPFRFDVGNRILYRDLSEVALTAGEHDLLEAMVRHPGQVLSRDTLITLLKGYERDPFDRSIDVCITRLRRKIEPDPAHPVYIRTVRGQGYFFSVMGKSRQETEQP